MRAALALTAAAAALPLALAADAHDGAPPAFSHTPPAGGVPGVDLQARVLPYGMFAGDPAQPRIEVWAADSGTGRALADVDYRLEVWSRGELLARGMFFAANGTLSVRVVPEGGCGEAEPWKCTRYAGAGGVVRPPPPGQAPEIRGPVFDRGGLYHVKASAEGAGGELLYTSPSIEVIYPVAQEYVFYIDPSG